MNPIKDLWAAVCHAPRKSGGSSKSSEAKASADTPQDDVEIDFEELKAHASENVSYDKSDETEQNQSSKKAYS